MWRGQLGRAVVPTHRSAGNDRQRIGAGDWHSVGTTVAPADGKHKRITKGLAPGKIERLVLGNVCVGTWRHNLMSPGLTADNAFPQHRRWDLTVNRWVV